MLLTDLKTLVEEIAQRDVPDLLFMRAVQAAVAEIEDADYRLVHLMSTAIPADGTNVYLMPAGATRENVQAVFYSTASCGPRKLVQYHGLIPTQDRAAFPERYYFNSSATMVVDAQPNEGQFTVQYREYHDLDLAIDSCTYPPLPSAVLKWLGANVWNDGRTKAWAEQFDRDLKAYLSSVILQGSDIGNLGDGHGHE